MIEYLKYVKHCVTNLISCSFKDWLRREEIVKLLRNNGYEVEEVPNPLRLHAYKEEEWFLIDVLVSFNCISVMQFKRGDIKGIASINGPFWNETIGLLHTLDRVLTPSGIN